ncbi:helix-turn-helix domain-containing protein [Flavitalea antarctica]
MTKDQILNDAKIKLSELVGEEVEVYFRPKKRLPVNKLKDAIAEELKTPWQTLLTRSNKRQYVLGRQLFSYLAHKDLSYGCVYIGAALGRDHTTAVHGRDTIADAISIRDKYITELVSSIRARLQ